MNTCFGCGEDNQSGLQLGPLARIEGDQIRIDFEVPRHFEGFEQVVHGGIIATILDEAMGLSCTRVQNVKSAVTRDLTLSFKAPVNTETPIQVRARSKREGRKLICSAEIYDAEGKVLATADSLWVLPASTANLEER